VSGKLVLGVRDGWWKWRGRERPEGRVEGMSKS
jgi:hypothetical protein